MNTIILSLDKAVNSVGFAGVAVVVTLAVVLFFVIIYLATEKK